MPRTYMTYYNKVISRRRIVLYHEPTGAHEPIWLCRTKAFLILVDGETIGAGETMDDVDFTASVCRILTIEIVRGVASSPSTDRTLGWSYQYYHEERSTKFRTKRRQAPPGLKQRTTIRISPSVEKAME